MTDPMELVGRAEHFDGAHKRGCEGRSCTCTYGDDETAMNLIAQMAACIREMVERTRPPQETPWDHWSSESFSKWVGFLEFYDHAPDQIIEWLRDIAGMTPAQGAEA